MSCLSPLSTEALFLWELTGKPHRAYLRIVPMKDGECNGLNISPKAMSTQNLIM